MGEVKTWVSEMKNDRLQHGSLDYKLYRYGRSKTLFRGPRPDFSSAYNVFLGSSETYGKFVPRPYPDLLQEELGVVSANFSALNAGVESYLRDPSVLLACADAAVTVLAVAGAHNVSNRYYMVHPRHNDRFVRASDSLHILYRQVEFTDIHYTRHLLNTLRRVDETSFALVVEELRAAWTARMKSLIEMIEGKTVLLWISDHAPGDVLSEGPVSAPGQEPLFVNQEMVDSLSPLVTKVVECIVPQDPDMSGTEGMVFLPCERRAAVALPGPVVHAQVARVLAPVLQSLL